jgi:DTW domain-containing protein YfiP
VLLLQHPLEDEEVLATAPLLVGSLGPALTLARGTSWRGLPEALGAPADPGRWAVLWRATPGEAAAPAGPLEGVIALDGTWAQAKRIWARNPWLAGLPRLALQPAEPGIYGKTRREPDRAAISTLEAVAEALHANGEDPALRAALRRLMRTMVQRARDTDPRKR